MLDDYVEKFLSFRFSMIQAHDLKTTIYDSDAYTVKDQQELLDKRIMRISNEAYAHAQDALLTQADITILLGESTKTISQHITTLETKGDWYRPEGNGKI
jgi:hypothetical protein